jgi:hypothetical protein
MPFIPIITYIGEAFLGSTVAAGVTAAASAVGAADIAAASLLPGLTVANLASGAIIGAGSSALAAAAQGGDILKAAESGAVGSAVGQIAGAAIGNALGIGEPVAGSIGPQQPTALQAAAQKGAASLIGGTAGGVATGRTPEAAFKASVPGAVGGALSGAAQYGLGLDASTAGLLGQGTSTALRYATTPTPSYTPPVQPGLSLQGPATQAPSPTLGQSLSIAPTLGYTPTGSVFGSSDAEGQKSNVWNVGSLRNIGSAEA